MPLPTRIQWRLSRPLILATSLLLVGCGSDGTEATAVPPADEARDTEPTPADWLVRWGITVSAPGPPTSFSRTAPAAGSPRSSSPGTPNSRTGNRWGRSSPTSDSVARGRTDADGHD